LLVYLKNPRCCKRSRLSRRWYSDTKEQKKVRRGSNSRFYLSQ